MRLSFLWLLRCRERVGIGIRIAPCDGEGAEAGVVRGAVRVELQIHPRLRARLRAESAPRDMSWNWSQLTTLGRLVVDGPATTSDLAQAEHLRRQSMAEIVAALRAGGLVESKPDPSDGR